MSKLILTPSYKCKVVSHSIDLGWFFYVVYLMINVISLTKPMRYL